MEKNKNFYKDTETGMFFYRELPERAVLAQMEDFQRADGSTIKGIAFVMKSFQDGFYWYGKTQTYTDMREYKRFFDEDRVYILNAK